MGNELNACCNPSGLLGQEELSLIDRVDRVKVDRSSMVKRNQGRFRDMYQLGDLIGRGAISEVRKCVNRSGMTRAVKIIDKQAMEQEHRQRLETEILIMQHMDHPNVCRLFEVFEEGRYYYLVMEYCANGELYDELRNAGCFSEHMAADLIEYLSYF